MVSSQSRGTKPWQNGLDGDTPKPLKDERIMMQYHSQVASLSQRIIKLAIKLLIFFILMTIC